MELTIVAAVSVVAIVAVSAFSRRIAVAAPLSLVVVGIAASFLPGLPAIDVDPKIILDGALPPLLYAAAVHMPAHDFRRDFKAIGGLAVLLVVLTTVCSGLLTILEGEGLVNDASSLVLLSSAVAATTVHLWKVGVDFIYAVVVAVAIGVVVGYANVRIRSLLKDPVMSTVASFVVPFLAWIPAEELGASGALAAVVAGLVTGHQSPRFLAARDRLTETVNWETVAFLLESGIFLLMGLQLKTLVDQDDVAGLNPWQAVAIWLAAAAVAVVLRVMFVLPLVAVLRQDAARGVSAKPQLQKMHSRITDPEMKRRFSARRLEHAVEEIGRKIADIDFFVKENFGWRGGGVLAWSGMRGVVITDLSAQAEVVLDDPALVRPDGCPFGAEVLDRVRQDTVRSGAASPPPEADVAPPRAVSPADAADPGRRVLNQLTPVR